MPGLQFFRLERVRAAECFRFVLLCLGPTRLHGTLRLEEASEDRQAVRTSLLLSNKAGAVWYRHRTVCLVQHTGELRKRSMPCDIQGADLFALSKEKGMSRRFEPRAVLFRLLSMTRGFYIRSLTTTSNLCPSTASQTLTRKFFLTKEKRLTPRRRWCPFPITEGYIQYPCAQHVIYTMGLSW